MRVVRDFTRLSSTVTGAAIAIGNFDGVHLGHQAVLEETCRIADSLRIPAAVLTFEPHPRRFFNPALPHLRIYALGRKLALLEKSGIDLVYLARFNQRQASMSAAEFIESMLGERLSAKHIVTGENFVFGRERQGDAALMAEKCNVLGIGYTQIPSSCDDVAHVVSSTRVREALFRGDMALVETLLARAYSLAGRVVQGDRRGRELGFNTANIYLPRIFLPAFGVYAVRVRVEREETWRKGVANLGIRPTFGENAPQLEVHLLEAGEDLYGKALEVELLHFIRPEQRFESKDALVEQIKSDVAQAYQFLSGA